MAAVTDRVEVAGVAVSPDHYIDGRRVASDRRFDDRSPVDGTHLADVAAGGREEVEQAVVAARRAFPAWRDLGPAGRHEPLMPSPRRSSGAWPNRRSSRRTTTARRTRRMRERVIRRGAHNIVLRRARPHRRSRRGLPARQRHGDQPRPLRALGRAALITPWNAPFMLATWKVGPALAAGCTVVLKPPEWAPLTCSLLADLADEAGLPAGVLNVVQGIGEEAGAALVAHPGIARISFTGSADGALDHARRRRAPLPVSFELGGKSPFVVFADADLERRSSRPLGQYDNAGQVCLAGTRLLVERSMLDAFLERVPDASARCERGSPLDDEARFGPLIHPDHLDRVAGFVERARAAGLEPALGGAADPELPGCYFRPTLFVEPPPGAEILRDEIFGPVLTLQSFSGEDEAVALANETEYGLAATVFTRSAARAERVAARLVAGTVWVNCFYVRDLRVPFGGPRQSGIGREGGRHSFDFFCDLKTVVDRDGSFADA